MVESDELNLNVSLAFERCPDGNVQQAVEWRQSLELKRKPGYRRLGKQRALGCATQKLPLGMKHSFSQRPGLLPAGSPWPDPSPR